VCTYCHGKVIGEIFGSDKRSKNNYVRIKNPLHPDSWKNDGHILRSRFNLEQALGRPLKRGYHVHHINGNIQDDRTENLMELSPSEHKKLHHQLSKNEKEAGRVSATPLLEGGD
jgi:hypothetical protein